MIQFDWIKDAFVYTKICFPVDSRRIIEETHISYLCLLEQWCNNSVRWDVFDALDETTWRLCWSGKGVVMVWGRRSEWMRHERESGDISSRNKDWVNVKDCQRLEWHFLGFCFTWNYTLMKLFFFCFVVDVSSWRKNFSLFVFFFVLFIVETVFFSSYKIFRYDLQERYIEERYSSGKKVQPKEWNIW